MNSVGKKVGKIVGCVLVGIVIALAFGWITMTLWNWLVPVLFNGPVITFWQSIGLLLLSKILFQGFGKGGHWRRDRCGDGHDHWKGKVFDKFSHMTPEERDAFKKKMKEKWCTRDWSHTDSKTEGSND